MNDDFWTKATRFMLGVNLGAIILGSYALGFALGYQLGGKDKVNFSIETFTEDPPPPLSQNQQPNPLP